MNTTTYSIYRRSYLEPTIQSYINIITINRMPNGPLSSIIKKVRFLPLSPFKEYNRQERCGFAFNSLTNPGTVMKIEELPDLISFLSCNNYIVDTKLTKIINSNDAAINTANNNLLFFITYTKN
jgi:hypothetical protein